MKRVLTGEENDRISKLEQNLMQTEKEIQFYEEEKKRLEEQLSGIDLRNKEQFE